MKPQVIDGYAEGLSSPSQIKALLSHSANLAQLLFAPETLVTIKTETFIIWGDEDPILPPKGRAEELRAALLKACLKLIPNCGHVPQEEVPAETNKSIGDFLLK